MIDSLAQQIDRAPEYLAAAWPGAYRAARALKDQMPVRYDEILLLGSGDSYHAALAIETAIAHWTSSRVRAAPAMLGGRYLLHRMRKRGVHGLVVGISASGEVARTLEALELANDAGFQTLAMTLNPQSSLAAAANSMLQISVPAMQVVPGILTYLASLLMGFALCAVLATADAALEINGGIELLPQTLNDWGNAQLEGISQFGERLTSREPIVFVGGGPAYGSALFAAAKVVEATGVQAWGQELEEWAHLEYFCEPADMPTWFLSSQGRTKNRESELLTAAQTIGRNVMITRWKIKSDLSLSTIEVLSPFGLWIGPAVFAAQLSDRLQESPFRGFGGGRSALEGGGASRIRSSVRIKTLQDLLMQRK